ncbi:hypothetical protein [Blastococcus sp. TF02A-26]|nr:hypothetical protein [Blastococcus sp. TF02A-26]
MEGKARPASRDGLVTSPPVVAVVPGHDGRVIPQEDDGGPSTA